MENKPTIDISVVTAVRNEEKNLQELHNRIIHVCEGLNKKFEIIYVENGSTDNSVEILKSLTKAKILILRTPVPPQKSMQTAALDAGIKNSRGKIIVTIDSDLQNPPEEIPKLLDKINKGYDVVSGWRKKRRDNLIIRNLSKLGSYIRSWIINPGVHDLGCTLKAYRYECFNNLNIYGEMHRYITAILKWRGFKVTEVEIKHVERKHGSTKYTWRKALPGFVDMWRIWFWKKYSDRPLHLFGSFGILLALLGVAILIILGTLRLFALISLSRSIWPLISILLVIVGTQLFIFGMLMDMLIRNYYVSSKEKSYIIQDIIEV